MALLRPTMSLLRLALVLGLLGCAAAPPPSPDAAASVNAALDVASADAPSASEDVVSTPDEERAFRALIGLFDSRAQALRDPRYLAIQLRTCEVAVPDLGPRVMYVEQARSDALSAPYRQRLYVVEPEEGGVRSRVFEFHTPAMVVGLCDDPSRADVRPEDVIEREGCAVHLRAVGDRFTGGTRGEGCESTLMGARYATSEVEFRDDGLDSWDRGFNAQGQQVWGATAGAYRFVRRMEP